MYSMNTRTYKINPVVFKYKMIQVNVIEKDNNINLEFSSGSYAINSQYNPCADNKGNSLTLKVDYSLLDKQKYESPGMECCFTLNSELNLYMALVESESGISLELFSGYYPMYLEHQNKTTILENKRLDLNNRIVHHNTVKVKLVNPMIE